VSLQVNPWGFRLENITTCIDIWQGEADVNIPHHAGRYRTDTLPNSRATFLPGEGHSYILKRWGETLEALLY
jgi:pimeloyl-ACP methyl ester carboxylesterase